MANDPSSPQSPVTQESERDRVTQDCLRSLGQLSGDAHNLQKVLTFFDSCGVDESMFTGPIAAHLPQEYGFLVDKMKFLDAKDILLKARLIGYVSYTTISVSYLAQHVISEDLLEVEKDILITITTQLLLQGFPNTWLSDQGHLLPTWKQCEMRVPHVIHLVGIVKKLEYGPSDPQSFADLVLRCSRYLYERERYNMAQDLLQVAIEQFPNKDGLVYAGALDLRGLTYLGTNHPGQALGDLTAALVIRQQLLGPDDALIGSSLNNLGLAYTETNDLEQAQKFHDQTLTLRLRVNSERIGDTYSNLSSTLLRLGRLDEAENMLFRCASSSESDDETDLDRRNPRFSGDLVLLGRIRRRQGRLDDALHLAARALSIRQSVLGNTPKTCEAMYLIADLLHQKDKIATARTLLYECISIAASVPEAEGYLAKAQYKLGMLYILDGDLQGAEVYLAAARSIRDMMLGDTAPVQDEESSFESLVPWMLW